MNLIIFFILAVIAVAGAIMVVTKKSPVAAALFLVLVMCSLAGLFALMGALFLAALQVIVYAGAIMVLFLFVIMLLNLRQDEYGRDPRIIQKYLGFALVVIILVQGILIVTWATRDFSSGMKPNVAAIQGSPDSTSVAVDYNSARSVALTLFSKYMYPFEVTSILLLAAIIGAVVIAWKRSSTEVESEDI